MPERRVTVTLEAPGAMSARVEDVFLEFTPTDRIKRSGILMLISLGLAVAFLPIPIIHLLAIPMIVIGGIVLAIRQLGMAGRLAPVRIACPKCGAMNRIGGGLGVRSADPIDRTCDSCRRILTRRITPAVSSPPSGS